jgi:hypothetical protein
MYSGGYGPDFFSAELIKNMVQGMYGLASKPSQVISGEFPVRPGSTDVSDVKPITQYGGELALAGMGVGMAAPPTSAGMFASIGSRTARLTPDRFAKIGLGEGSVVEAMDMAKKGIHRDEVFARTGWFQDAGGNWLSIINDRNARMKLHNLDNLGTDPNYPQYGDLYGPKAPNIMKPGTQKVGDVFDHPELYEAYPFLKDIPIEYIPPEMVTGAGGYRMSGGYHPPMGSTPHKLALAPNTPEGLQSVLVHELQHAIQYRELHGRGGSAGEFLPPGFEEGLAHLENGKNDIENLFHQAGLDPNDVQRYHGIGPYSHLGPERGFLSPMEEYLMKAIPSDMIKSYGNLLNMHDYASMVNNRAFKDYLNLSGEVVSRAAQSQGALKDWSQPLWRIPDFTGTMGVGGYPAFWYPVEYGNQLSIHPYRPPYEGGLLDHPTVKGRKLPGIIPPGMFPAPE